MSSTEVYHGSCHCGDVKYQIRITLPPAVIEKDGELHFMQKTTRIYKCNCTICHKLGMFHCRPADPFDDFILTSPSNSNELGAYNSQRGPVYWHSCKKCAARVFAAGGKWIQEELDVETWAARGGGDKKSQVVSRIRPHAELKGFDGSPLAYISVNAVTLDGADLIDWHKKGWVCYYENKERKGKEMPQTRQGEPFPGGCY